MSRSTRRDATLIAFALALAATTSVGASRGDPAPGTELYGVLGIDGAPTRPGDPYAGTGDAAPLPLPRYLYDDRLRTALVDF